MPYTLSLHDALPILEAKVRSQLRTVPADDWAVAWTSFRVGRPTPPPPPPAPAPPAKPKAWERSEEHTSELQSRENLVCRLLLEKKKERSRPHAECGA